MPKISGICQTLSSIADLYLSTSFEMIYFYRVSSNADLFASQFHSIVLLKLLPLILSIYCYFKGTDINNSRYSIALHRSHKIISY